MIRIASHILIVLFVCLQAVEIKAQVFTDHFQDKTLRVDYLFSGNRDKQAIVLGELSQLPSWAGRHHKLAKLPLEGNGQIVMKNPQTGTIIYKTSFSTLFQEWLMTEEAQTLNRGFENTYLLPFPKYPVDITVTLKDNRGKVTTEFTHHVNPEDILIRQKGHSHVNRYKYLLNNGNAEDCIDVVILPEGYSREEMELFYQDAEKACESLFAHEPFKKLKSKFNIIAVEVVSQDSGVSIPGKKEWKNTAFSSHFNTFYSDRYLTTSRVKDVHNALAGIPYEHIIILANTEQYGGGGIYNGFTLTTAHHKSFEPVVVHEFGHSFAGLADEYYYENDIFSDTYPFDVEPWEQNITTLVDFSSKWKELIAPGTPIPTKPETGKEFAVGVYEGAGYSSKGIYRPAINCRMKTNEAAAFCPACQKAIENMITFYTNK